MKTVKQIADEILKVAELSGHVDDMYRLAKFAKSAASAMDWLLINFMAEHMDYVSGSDCGSRVRQALTLWREAK